MAVYKQFWETQNITTMPSPKNKYSDVAPTPAAGLMHGNIYASIYQRTTGPHSRAIVRSNKGETTRTFRNSNQFTARAPEFTDTSSVSSKPITSLKDHGASPKKGEQNDKSRFHRKIVEGRHDDRFDMTEEEAFTNRPTHNWKTNSDWTYDGWAAKDALEQNMNNEKAVPDHSGKYISREAENSIYRGSFRYNDLRKTPAASGYTLDFGKFGDNPKDRLKESNNLTSISTSRDLARGGARKNVVPGYTGFMPQHSNGLSSTPSKDRVKNDMLFTFRHDMPGYTGYKPVNVTNDRGPRVPSALNKNIEGLHAGLIVDSMSTTKKKQALKYKGF